MRDDTPGSESDDYLLRRTSASDYIFREVREAGVRLVRCLWADLSNIIRGRAIHVEALRRHLVGGVSVPAHSMGLTTTDLLADPSLQGKVALVPDPATFHLISYAPNTAVMLGELFETDQQPWALCPRSFLKRMMADLADSGLYLRIGVELEYYYGTRASDGSYAAVDDSLYAATQGMTVAAKVINDVVGSLDDQRIGLEHYHPEAGGGQQELTLTAVDPLSACDRIVFTRETVRAIAWAHGWYASFAPKPFEAHPPSGLHLHLSLSDHDGRNLMAGGDGDQRLEPGRPYAMTPRAAQFVAGILRHLPGLMALACPTANSYRRMQPNSSLPPYTAWGYDNVHTLVRQVPLTWNDAPASAHVELKFPDGSANPYLLMGSIAAAGMDGVLSQLPLGDPIEGSPASLSPDQRARLGIDLLPVSLPAACDALERDASLAAALSAPLLETYLAVKRHEARAYEGMASPAEAARYFWKF